MEFDSMAKFATHLATRELSIALEARRGLKEAAEIVEKSARSAMGEYQSQVGPFPAWAALSPATIYDRLSKGYSPDEPLLRDGTLRDSISHTVEATEAIVGSTSDIAVFQELGTSKIPPRPFLGPAVIHNERRIQKIMGRALVKGLLGDAAIAEVGYVEREIG